MKFIQTALAVVVAAGSIAAQGAISERILQARQKVFPALVHIQPVKEVFSSGDKVKMQITGSGVIISKDGYVVTNNHVAEQASFVRCTLSSRHEVDAAVVGLDPWTDLAVLKLDLATAGLDSVPFARFGNSDQLQVGQVVLALGSPLGLARSLSMGVVSSIDRYFEDVGEMVSPYNLWIQTDAAINPGNSGGPLIDLNGRVVGINARAVVFGENLGFAIPVNTVRYVVRQIMERGEVERSWIGVDWQEIKEYRRYKNDPELSGVLVADVTANSPADRAGLQPGDLVTAVNRQAVNALYQEELPKIRLLISNMPVGSRLGLEVVKGPDKRVIELDTEKQGKFTGTEYQCDAWGLSVKEITPRIIRNFQLNSEKGVLISGVRRGGPADEAEIVRGYILTRVDGQQIYDLEDFKKRYKVWEREDKDHLLFLQFAERNRFALIKGGAGR